MEVLTPGLQLSRIFEVRRQRPALTATKVKSHFQEILGLQSHKLCKPNFFLIGNEFPKVSDEETLQYLSRITNEKANELNNISVQLQKTLSDEQSCRL